LSALSAPERLEAHHRIGVAPLSRILNMARLSAGGTPASQEKGTAYFMTSAYEGIMHSHFSGFHLYGLTCSLNVVLSDS
jgi:hypothetical protein